MTPVESDAMKARRQSATSSIVAGRSSSRGGSPSYGRGLAIERGTRSGLVRTWYVSPSRSAGAPSQPLSLMPN